MCGVGWTASSDVVAKRRSYDTPRVGTCVALAHGSQGRCSAPREPRPLFMSMEEQGLQVYLVLGFMKDFSFSTCTAGATAQRAPRATGRGNERIRRRSHAQTRFC